MRRMSDDETLDDPDCQVPVPAARPSGPGERFWVLSELGRGGMGVVERAYDSQLQREVALKRVNQQGLDDRQPPERIVEVLLQAGRGLAAAHDAGLVHRDFKPANVLVGLDGRPRVTDFGLAQPVEGVGQQLATVSSRAGSPAYMAPEQATGEVSQAADQFAFCVTCWQALTGELPYRGARSQVVSAKREGPQRFPENPAVPDRVVRALSRGLDSEPARRFADMHQLLDAMAPPVPRASRSLALMQVGGVLAVLVGTLLGYRQVLEQRCSGATVVLESTWSEARREALADVLADDAELRSASRGTRREPALRAPGGSVHRRPAQRARALPRRRRGHAVPRRGRGAAPLAVAQAAAGARGG